jgi:hypothetical protein
MTRTAAKSSTCPAGDGSGAAGAHQSRVPRRAAVPMERFAGLLPANRRDKRMRLGLIRAMDCSIVTGGYPNGESRVKDISIRFRGRLVG